MPAATKAKPATKSTAEGKDGSGKDGGSHWVTVAYPNGGYHHIHVEGHSGEGAKAGIGKHKPIDKPGSKAKKIGESKVKANGKEERAKSAPHPNEAEPHSRHEPAPYQPGEPLSVQRDHWHDSEERRLAAMIPGSKWNSGNEPADVTLPKESGVGNHQLEMKSKGYLNSQKASVHAGALENKINDSHANPHDEWHTVMTDHRDKSEGGIWAKSYSGHSGYYKRAVGENYTTKNMHPFKDAAELNRLIHMPYDQLPEKAKGKFLSPTEMVAFREKAARDRAYNNKRSRDSKAEAKAKGLSPYRNAKNYGRPDQKSSSTDSSG